MSDDFDPYTVDRPPRSEGYKEETEELFELIREERGDQRIGQFLINVVRASDMYEKIHETSRGSWQEDVEQTLWNLEAPELLNMAENYVDSHARKSNS